jgi:hypothetical protein
LYSDDLPALGRPTNPNFSIEPAGYAPATEMMTNVL